MVRMTKKLRKQIMQKTKKMLILILVCLTAVICISRSNELEKFVVSKVNSMLGINDYKTSTISESEEGNKKNTNELKTLEVIGFHIKPEFSPEVREYELEKLEEQNSVEVFATAFNPEATITITGNDNLVQAQNIIKIIVSSPNGGNDVEYTITCKNGTRTQLFSYIGEQQEFIAPYTGIYKMETWGARGGGSRCNGAYYTTYGKGGYASGEIALRKGEKLYIYVGGQGTDAVVGKDSEGGYNGGGLGTWDRTDDESAGGGGGATDIRLVSGNWNDITSLCSRIMVAGRRWWSIMDF